jgi:hypothetical protein
MLGGEMFGRIVAGLVVVGLAFGVWILWAPEETGNSVTTPAVPTTSSSTTTLATTTTGMTSTTSTDIQATDVISTVEEAEDLLTELWFGWFEGIYEQDEERVKEVVASQNQLDAARDQFGMMNFSSRPQTGAISPGSVEILRSDTDCIAIWSNIAISDFTEVAFEGVHVFRLSDETWKFVALWASSDDLWEQDCESSL